MTSQSQVQRSSRVDKESALSLGLTELDLHRLGDAGRAVGRNGKQVPVAGDHDAGVGGGADGELAVGADGEVLERHAALVGVDRVGDGAHAHQGELVVGGGGALDAGDGKGERVAGADGGLVQVADHGAGGGGAVGVEQVGGRQDLAVGVVDRLVALGGRALDGGDVAETAAADEDGGVGQQDGDGVVVAGLLGGGQLGPGLGGRVEHLGDEDGVGVAEDDGALHASGDDDLAVGQDDGVGEAALEGHVGDALDDGGAAGLADGGDVGAVVGVAVGVVGRAAGAQDLAAQGVEHDKDAAHGVGVVAGAGVDHGAVALGAVPVLRRRGAGLEHGPVAPGKEPGVVVLAPDALVVLGQHGLDVGALEHLPLVGAGVVDLALLAAPLTRVGAADGEHLAVGQRARRLVATRDLQVGLAREGVRVGVVDRDGVGVGSTLDQDATVGQLADAGAEHVVVRVGDLAVRRLVRGQVERAELRQARRATKGVHAPRREEHEPAGGREGRHDVGGHGDQRQGDDVGPDTLLGVADDHSLVGGLGSLAILGRLARGRRRVGAVGQELGDGVKVGIDGPDHVRGLVVVLDVADRVLLVVDGADTLVVVVAQSHARPGAADALDNLERLASVLEVGSVADGQAHVLRRLPDRLLGCAVCEARGERRGALRRGEVAAEESSSKAHGPQGSSGLLGDLESEKNGLVWCFDLSSTRVLHCK
ncbi:hypothetical protein PoMZ_09424 [Pyricularia oryzae]|uniref:Uncharacterized protein n=1 Tax=Pyricularia oryzae TaxID=318829 RepID=A0A4V1C4Q8_PYROR|nr:hypothetical protein PoMZ_09424 [Pyricularia oryzae]